MQEEASIWDILFSGVRFFEGVGTEYVAEDPSGFAFDAQSAFVPTPENPAVYRITQEVLTGWTPETVTMLWGPFYIIGLFITLIFLSGITYCVIRIFQIRHAENLALLRAVSPVASGDVSRTKLRWQRVIEQVESGEENKWRLAILEADIMLNDLLDVLGYKGETMGDKMKQADISTFNSIDFAWEAHKIRNVIAHEGSQYQLNEREARRVIKMYERVFREFKYVE